MPMHSPPPDPGKNNRKKATPAPSPDTESSPDSEVDADGGEDLKAAASPSSNTADLALFQFARHLLNSHEKVAKEKQEHNAQGQKEVAGKINDAVDELVALAEMVKCDETTPGILPERHVTVHGGALLECAAACDIDIQRELKKAYEAEQDRSRKIALGLLRFEVDLVDFTQFEIAPALLKMPGTTPDNYQFQSDLVASMSDNRVTQVIKELVLEYSVQPASESPLVQALLRAHTPECIIETLDTLEREISERQGATSIEYAGGDSATLDENLKNLQKAQKFDVMKRSVELIRLATHQQTGLTDETADDLLHLYQSYTDHSLKDLAANCLIAHDAPGFATTAFQIANNALEEYSDRLPALRHYAEATEELALPELTRHIAGSDCWMALQATKILSNPDIVSDAGPLLLQNRIAGKVQVPDSSQAGTPIEELAYLLWASSHDDSVAQTLKGVFSTVEIPKEVFQQLDSMEPDRLPSVGPIFELGQHSGARFKKVTSDNLLENGIGHLKLLRWRVEAADRSDSDTLATTSTAALACLAESPTGQQLFDRFQEALSKRLPTTADEEAIQLLRKIAGMQSVPIGAAMQASDQPEQSGPAKEVKNSRPKKKIAAKSPETKPRIGRMKTPHK